MVLEFVNVNAEVRELFFAVLTPASIMLGTSRNGISMHNLLYTLSVIDSNTAKPFVPLPLSYYYLLYSFMDSAPHSGRYHDLSFTQ